jgi:hypothetical protein
MAPALVAGLIAALNSLSSFAEAPAPSTARSADRLVVHEWGTFTCLQDEAGRSITGINSDDEALPHFVHRLAQFLQVPPVLPPIYYKGIPRIHPEVTMRLETPVIYFYPPAQARQPLQLDVRVRFHGGWLSEYYPAARVESPKMEDGRFRFSPLNAQSEGSLAWDDLHVGATGEPPQTDYHVWTAPRQVAAAGLTAASGESEKYLFYRGVAHREAPLQVVRSADGQTLVIRERFDPALFERSSPVPAIKLWHVSIRPGGAAAWRPLGAPTLSLRSGAALAKTPATFAEGEYSMQRLTELREEMRHALLADGLFADEAEALLNTWELGYFRSPGDRLFFLLPRAWTDATLPLELSLPADVVRTMVGRIELVTPRHRELLTKLEDIAPSKLDWLYGAVQDRMDAEMRRKLWEGRLAFDQLGVEPPQDYRLYLDLGRFRNALILDELNRDKESPLAAFAQAYGLSYYQPNQE